MRNGLDILIGSRIRLRRLEVAERLDDYRVSDIEEGWTPPKWEDLERLAIAFRTDVLWFFPDEIRPSIAARLLYLEGECARRLKRGDDPMAVTLSANRLLDILLGLIRKGMVI